MNNYKPMIGISVGDPAGIGPEVTAKALSLPEIYEICRPVVIAESEMFNDAIKYSGLHLKVNSIIVPNEGIYEAGKIDVIDLKNINAKKLKHKLVSAECGRASYEYVKKVIDLALTNEIDATVTGPINKEAINKAGYPYAGHTEIYATLTKTKKYAMMLAHKKFRVIHVSTHVSMHDALIMVNVNRVCDVINLGYNILVKLGIKNPRIAVAGLNPHAGENGLFGNQEIEEIKPAIARASKKCDVVGPIPADTVFSKMLGGQFDLVVVMYHDQGHIPIKLLGFNYNKDSEKWNSISGINITCGLPIIRVSVDHGTAFGKAGEGRANPESMIEAIKTASLLAYSKSENKIQNN